MRTFGSRTLRPLAKTPRALSLLSPDLRCRRRPLKMDLGYCFSQTSPIYDASAIDLMVSDMGHILERVFLYPGKKVCDACHVQAGGDRVMIRTLVNVIVWNIVVVLVVVSVY